MLLGISHDVAGYLTGWKCLQILMEKNDELLEKSMCNRNVRKMMTNSQRKKLVSRPRLFFNQFTKTCCALHCVASCRVVFVMLFRTILFVSCWCETHCTALLLLRPRNLPMRDPLRDMFSAVDRAIMRGTDLGSWKGYDASPR